MPVPNEVNLAIRDRAGKSASASFFVGVGFSVAQYTEMAEILANAVDAIIGGVIEGCTLRLPADVSALINNTVGATSDVGDVGQFQFRSTENRPVRINVPGLLETLVADNSDALDQADPDVAAFIAAMEDGLVTIGGTMQPCNKGEDDITTTEFSRERFRNRGARS